MGRLSKSAKEFRAKAGMSAVELARMIRKQHNEELERSEKQAEE